MGLILDLFHLAKDRKQDIAFKGCLEPNRTVAEIQQCDSVFISEVQYPFSDSGEQLFKRKGKDGKKPIKGCIRPMKTVTETQQSGVHDSEVQYAYSDNDEKLCLRKGKDRKHHINMIKGGLGTVTEIQQNDVYDSGEPVGASVSSVLVETRFSSGTRITGSLQRAQKQSQTSAIVSGESIKVKQCHYLDPGSLQECPKQKQEEFDEQSEEQGVMVITPLPSQATCAFLGKLAERLRDAPYQISLKETDVGTFNKRKKERNLVIVICNNHSRIKTDVTNSLKYIHERLHEMMFVVILHCLKKKQLSTERLSGKLKADFPNVHHFVEMAFDQDLPEGIYDCELNKNALKEIAQKKDAFAKELPISRWLSYTRMTVSNVGPPAIYDQKKNFF